MNPEANMSLSQVAVMNKGFKGNQYQQPTEFQCPVCKKYFSRKCTLQMHLLIHQDVKPHICPFCGQSFRQKGTLMRHKALHSKTALFHCELCNKNYRQKNVFLHHLRHRHNVATDSLDRRRDTTRLADNQSLLKQLPSFAKADDRVINMSDKTFENLLLNSLGTESVNTMRQKYKISSSFPSSTTDQSLIVELTGVQSNKMEWVNHSENQNPLHPYYSNDNGVSYGECKRDTCEIPKVDVAIRWQCQYCSFDIRFDHQACWDHLSIHRNDRPYDCYRCLQLFRNEKDCKSHMLNHHSLLMNQIDSKLRADKELVCEESANSELLISDVESDISVQSGVVTELEKADVRHSEVSDSLYLQDMTYTCIPCQLDFSCEDEFEVHVKSHVQSILVTDDDESEKSFVIPGIYGKSDQLSHGSAPSSEICSVKSCDSATTSQASCSLYSPNYDRHEKEREESGWYEQKKSFLCEKEGKNMNFNNCLGMSEKLNVADPKKQSERDISQRNTINGETCERNNNNSMRNSCRTIVKTVMAFFCPYCDLYFDKKTSLQKHVDKHVRLLAVQIINGVAVNRKEKISFGKNVKRSCLVVKEGSCKRNCSKPLEMSVLQNKVSFSIDSNCSNQKQFVCQKCGEKFQKKNNYLYHKQLHFRKRSFSSFCKSQKFIKNKHLKHTRNRHVKQYQCSKCMKTFFCYKIMKLHHNQCLNNCLGSCLEKYVENLSLPVADLTKKNDNVSPDVIGIIPVGALQCSSHTFSENFNANNRVIGIPVISLQSLPELGSLPLIGKISLKNPTAK